MKKTGFALFGVLLFFIIATGTGIYIKSISNYEPKAEYVYASQDIPAKAIITEKMVALKEKPISDGHRLSVTDINEVIGKRATVDIIKDEMLLKSRLVNPNDRTSEIELTNKNNRKFTVEFKPDQACGWCLTTNQQVDIIFVPNPGLQNQEIQTVPTTPDYNKKKPDSIGFNKSNITRLQNVRIAGIIDEAGNVIDSKKDVIPKYICFEVDKNQDEFLAWAKSNGRLEVSAVPLENETNN